MPSTLYGAVFMECGEWTLGLTALGKASALIDDLGVELDSFDRQIAERASFRAGDRLTAQEVAQASSAGRAMQLDDVVSLVLAALD